MYALTDSIYSIGIRNMLQNRYHLCYNLLLNRILSDIHRKELNIDN